MFVGGKGRFIHTSEYTNYLEAAAWEVKAFCVRNGVKPINQYTPLFLYFYLKNMRMDSHNLKKVLFDSLEKGGLFENDLYILDRTMAVVQDRTKPRVEMYIGEIS